MRRNVFTKLIVVLFLALEVGALSGNPVKEFKLEKNKDCVKIINGATTVYNIPGKLGFVVRGPYGKKIIGARGKYPLEKIEVLKDTDEEKSVFFVSRKCDYYSGKAIFTLQLSANLDSPMVKILCGIKNPAQEREHVKRYFNFHLTPLHCPYYYNPEGWQNAGKTNVTIAKWLYLPMTGTTGGYGVIPINIEKSRLFTIYPRKDWQKVGLYFAPSVKPRLLEPGEEAFIGCYIFPATSKWQVLDEYEKRSKGNDGCEK